MKTDSVAERLRIVQFVTEQGSEEEESQEKKLQRFDTLDVGNYCEILSHLYDQVMGAPGFQTKLRNESLSKTPTNPLLTKLFSKQHRRLEKEEASAEEHSASVHNTSLPARLNASTVAITSRGERRTTSKGGFITATRTSAPISTNCVSL